MSSVEPDITHLSTHLSRWQHMEQIYLFLEQGVKEYISQLQEWPKWIKSAQSNTETRKFVIIKEGHQPTLLWVTGRADAVHPGADGIVRTTKFKVFACFSWSPFNVYCHAFFATISSGILQICLNHFNCLNVILSFMGVIVFSFYFQSSLNSQFSLLLFLIYVSRPRDMIRCCDFNNKAIIFRARTWYALIFHV